MVHINDISFLIFYEVLCIFFMRITQNCNVTFNHSVFADPKVRRSFGAGWLSSSLCSWAGQWINCLRVRNVSGEQSVTTVHNYIPAVGTRHFERLMKWLVVCLQTT